MHKIFSSLFKFLGKGLDINAAVPKGYSEAELNKFENELGQLFPRAYRTFSLDFGLSLGMFREEEWDLEFGLQMKEWLSELLMDEPDSPDIERLHLISSRYGEQFACIKIEDFHLGDPPVYYFNIWDSSLVKVTETFTQYLTKTMGYYSDTSC